MMSEKKLPTYSIVVAAKAWRLYGGRSVWEQRFRATGLWPEALAYGAVSQKYGPRIDDLFPSYQLLAVIDSTIPKVVGVAHSVPLFVNSIDALPSTGWDWALQTSVQGHVDHIDANCLCGLSISVLPEYQRNGIGTALILGLREVAVANRLRELIVPVRPITKSARPFVPMVEFLRTETFDCLHSDPWIRAHQKVGGTLKSICRRSMTVCLPMTAWQRWISSPIARSGFYVMEGALAPVAIDIEKAVGFYREPNVWMAHEVGSKIRGEP